MQTRFTITEANGVVTLTLVPPVGKPPTLDESSLSELEAAIVTLEQRPPAALIIESAEAKYFCVGANVEALRRTREDGIAAWVRRGHEVFNRLAALSCPTVARVEGYALGGGLELAMACDLIYAADSALFGQTEAKLGFVPGWGGSRRLVERVGVAQAKRLFYTAAIVGATEAHRLGLADFVGGLRELETALESFVRDTGVCSQTAIATFKRIIDNGGADGAALNAEAEVHASQLCVADVDTVKRLGDFLSRREILQVDPIQSDTFDCDKPITADSRPDAI